MTNLSMVIPILMYFLMEVSADNQLSPAKNAADNRLSAAKNAADNQLYNFPINQEYWYFLFISYYVFFIFCIYLRCILFKKLILDLE